MFGMTEGELRCVENDRGKRGLCSEWQGWGSEWQELARVISSEGRNLRSVNGVCAMSLDSSLRCAAFGMTEGRGGCVRNDRGKRALCSEWQSGRASEWQNGRASE